MAPSKRVAAGKFGKTGAASSGAAESDAGFDAPSVLASLERVATKKTRDGLGRYGIVTAWPVLGVAMSDMQRIAKPLRKALDGAGRHRLAAALWDSGIYDARMLAALVDDPALVTRAQMAAWAKEFDNWAICDTLCFHLFDRCPHAWPMAVKWCGAKPEFEKRTAFALVASIALHDKTAADQPFVDFLPRIEKGATDGRNFVKKGVSWALRGIGRRNRATLRKAAIAVAERLAGSKDAAAKWVGRDALRDLGRAKTKARKK
jgi:3-methyladenine DNA glycosylase AlkD